MGTIKGVVRNASDVPLENVNVLIVSGPSHPDIAAISNTEGRFSLNSLQPGSYILQAFGDEKSDQISIDVVADQPSFIEIRL